MRARKLPWSLLVGSLPTATLLTIGLGAQSAVTPPIDAAAFRSAFSEVFGRSPGAVVAGLTRGSTIVATCARGALAGQSADETTLFDVEELAQEFTAALTLRLTMSGALRLEDTVASHFDGVPAAWQGLSLRHLLQRTSGLPLDLALREDVVEERDTFVRELLRYAPRAAPGSNHTPDCRADWHLLAAVAEATTVLPFDRLLQERVFTVAAMPHAKVTAAAWDERGDAGVRCSLRDVLQWMLATGNGRVFDEAAQRVFFDDTRDVGLAGRVVRRAPHGVQAFERVHDHVVVVRSVSDRTTLVVLAAENPALGERARSLSEAVWPSLTLGDSLQALVGRYRLSSGGSFDVALAGTSLQVRAIGHSACARLLYGQAQHPEWPELFRDLEAHARLHLRPLLKRDAAGLARVFAGTDAGAAQRAVTLIERLVAQHGEPGKAEILGTRTFGSNATWLRIPFGTTPVTLRTQWHAYQWSDVSTSADEYPVSQTFLADADGTFVGASADGKQKLRIEFARPGPPRSLRFKDASKTGRDSVLCTRE